MAVATTALPSGNLGRAASHSGDLTSRSSTTKLSATAARQPSLKGPVCRKATPRGPRRSRQIQPPLPAAPVNICRAMISPISAMSVAKITADKGGAGRGLNLKDPKGRLPKPRYILKIHRPLSHTTHRRENRTANQPLSWTPSSPGQYTSR